MSKIEAELVQATDFEAARDYDRQDYLAALAKEVNKLKDATFERLSDDAAEWFNNAVRALKANLDLPDFPDYEPDEEGEEEEAPKPKTKAKAKEVETKRRPKGQPPRKLEHAPVDPDAAMDKFETDKYGVVKGSKNAAAISMFEKGCRMSDVTHSIGGTYYNLLDRLRKQGHTVDKGANGHIKLTHK